MQTERNLSDLIRQELPHETYIEMAIQYYQWNLPKKHCNCWSWPRPIPMVRIWQAWILDKTGKKTEAEANADEAMTASPELVFPFRPEMTSLFSWAEQQKHSWKWRYYEALDPLAA